jgi:hypothetical protein
MIMDDLSSSCNDALPHQGEGQQILGVTILELRLYSCRFIIRYDDDAAIYCGDTGRPYCMAHRKLCYLPKVNRPDH